MTFAPIPTADQIIQLYQAGELAVELGCYHEGDEDQSDAFSMLCIGLHNSGSINLVSVPSQPAFADIDTHSFFTAQNFYCNAIPELRTSAVALMECCRILIQRSGTDLAAGFPNGAFRKWCARNKKEGAAIIRDARAGNELARQFVTFAIQAANDVSTAIEFTQTFDDDRRLCGIWSLSGIDFPDESSARRAVEVLAPFIAEGSDDVRRTAVRAAFDVLKRYDDQLTVRSLFSAAASDAGPKTLHAIAEILWLHHSMLDKNSVQTGLHVLERVDPNNLGTIRQLDSALRCILDTASEELALNFLTEFLRNGELTAEQFQSTANKLTHERPRRLYELIVGWLISGNASLCHNAASLAGYGKEHIFNESAESLGLTPIQQIFLCRKAIGFLFVYPVTCCSILLSVLRAADELVASEVTKLLSEALLLSYGGNLRDYLKGITVMDPAYGPIQEALKGNDNFYASLDSIGSIKELYPSENQRNLVHQHSRDQMHEAQKKAESKSVILNLVHRSIVLYGRRTLSYVTDLEGEKRAIEMDLRSHHISWEMPRLETIDPVGLDYMLRIYRAEQLK